MSLIKLKMLWMYSFHVLEWWRDVGSQDEVERMCCNGYECGCQGADYASYWEWLWKTRKARRS